MGQSKVEAVLEAARVIGRFWGITKMLDKPLRTNFDQRKYGTTVARI